MCVKNNKAIFCTNLCHNMQQSKKLVSFMNIMCVKNNKAIFYVFVNIGSKNTQFYKDEIFIPQNPKKKLTVIDVGIEK
jgi:hypothetical protein